jgi:type I restriction enzyme S subunit
MSKGRAQTTTSPRFEPYPSYKDSGVEWLREIPAHWEVKKLAWLTKCLDGSRVPLNAEERGSMQGEYPYWGANSVVDYVDKWLFDEELVLLGEDGAPFFDQTKMVAFHVSGKIWVNNHAHVLRRRRMIDAAFLSHALNCVGYRAFIDGTTRDKLTQGDMNTIPIQCPELDEQRVIAAFLGRETAKIDALVAKKKRLIELLQEKRTAFITRAVTKGLDPKVPMKESGEDWLGQFPVRWDLAPVYARYEVALGKMLDAKRVTGEFSGRYLRNVDVQWDAVNIEGLPEMDFAPWERERYLLRPGDLLVCEGGEVGRTAIWRAEIEECFYQKAIHRVRPRSEDNVPRFFYYLMHMLVKRGVLVAGGNPNTIDHLTAVQLRHYRLPFAPPEEQRLIAAVLDRETARIDALVAKVHDGIDRLKEYRTALISAAVTGKIDVQGEAA